MSLSDAIAASLGLKACLAAEVARAREVRGLLRAMNTAALLEQAAHRDSFNHLAARLSHQLADALRVVATGWELADVTLPDIEARAPFEGAQLASVFAEVRALSASLAELDELNRHLAERALTYVHAYVAHLSPRSAAYTRKGLSARADTSTYSEHA